MCVCVFIFSEINLSTDIFEQQEAPTKEEVKATASEENKEEKPPASTEEEKKPPAEKEKKEEPNKPPSPFVLFVDLHCTGCAKKIERSISKIRGTLIISPPPPPPFPLLLICFSWKLFLLLL